MPMCSSTTSSSSTFTLSSFLTPNQKSKNRIEPLINENKNSPKRPELMDWSTHYPAYFSQPNEDGSIAPGEKKVEWADVGCGFGGLLMALAPLFPEKLMLGTSHTPLPSS